MQMNALSSNAEHNNLPRPHPNTWLIIKSKESYCDSTVLKYSSMTGSVVCYLLWFQLCVVIFIPIKLYLILNIIITYTLKR